MTLNSLGAGARGHRNELSGGQEPVNVPVVALFSSSMAAEPGAQPAECAADVDPPAGRQRHPPESPDLQFGGRLQPDQQEVDTGLARLPEIERRGIEWLRRILGHTGLYHVRRLYSHPLTYGAGEKSYVPPAPRRRGGWG